MALIRHLVLVVAAVLPLGALAQSTPGGTPSSAAMDHAELVAGTPVQFVTVDELSSKRQAKGDRVALRTVGDTLVNGRVVIPANSAAVGEISDAHGTGGLGVSGKLVVAPLYITIAGTTIRFSGTQIVQPHSGVDTVLGVTLLMSAVSGKSAVKPAGTRLEGYVLHTVSVPIAKP